MTLRTADLLLADGCGLQQLVELVDPRCLGLEPGLQPVDYAEKELSIEVSDRMLAIKGSHMKEAKDEEHKEFALRERLEREFERCFILPSEADTEHLKAAFSEGVLEVHAPKLEAAKPREVAITK